jgi:hypothetical protein
MVSRSTTARMVAAAIAAGLILIGVLIATRLVGDESLRAHDSATSGQGTVSAVQNSWDGSQRITVIWSDANAYGNFLQPVNYWATPKVYTTHFLNCGPGYSVGDVIAVAFDPKHPSTGAVLADQGITVDPWFRADSVMQSLVPFAVAAIVLAFLVIWPGRRSPAFRDYSLVSVRKCLYWYGLTPCIVCAVAVAVPIAAQHYVADPVAASPLSLLAAILIIWPMVRAFRYRQLESLLTTTQDAVDSDAIVTSVEGRKLRIDMVSEGQLNADIRLGRVDVRALRGQPAQLFAAGDRVRLYGRWHPRGPTLLAAGVEGYEKLLIGRGRRCADADHPVSHLAAAWEWQSGLGETP